MPRQPLCKKKLADKLLNLIFASQEQNGVETKKNFQSYPPKDLINKLANELPKGVEPTQKEVGVLSCYNEVTSVQSTATLIHSDAVFIGSF